MNITNSYIKENENRFFGRVIRFDPYSFYQFTDRT